MTKFAGVLLVGLVIVASFKETKGANKNLKPVYAVKRDETKQEIYTASWAVEVVEGGDKMADTIASRYGFQNIGKV